MAASVRAGRLARALESDGERRAALRIQPAHARGRQSAVVRGRRRLAVRHRQRGQRLNQRRSACVARSDAASEDAGWDRGLLAPSRARLAPRTGFALALDNQRLVIRGGYGIFLNQWAYSVQTAFARNLPFFFSKEVAVPSDLRVPAFQTRDILTRDPTAVISPSIMDYDYTVEYTQTW